jgi:hypothetical protein
MVGVRKFAKKVDRCRPIQIYSSTGRVARTGPIQRGREPGHSVRHHQHPQAVVAILIDTGLGPLPPAPSPSPPATPLAQPSICSLSTQIIKIEYLVVGAGAGGTSGTAGRLTLQP